MGGDQIPKAKGPNNEDQLLQDASTLLMFANTAAKQQEVKKSPSPPVLGMNRSVTPTSRPPSQHQLPTLASHQHVQPVQPVQPAQPAQHKVFDPVRQIYVPASVPASGPASQSGSTGASPDVKPTEPPQLQQPFTGMSQHVHYQPPFPHHHSHSPPAISNITNPASPQFPPSFNSAPVSQTHSTRSSVSESHQAPKPHPPSAGSGHRRTNSTPGNENNPANYKNSLSPGPASVVLARGIDSETGKRNNDNAMIAAAALAQAADNPLPLLKREEAKRIALENEQSHSIIKSEPASEPPAPGPTSDPSIKQEEKNKKPSSDAPSGNRLSVRRSVVDTSYVAPPLPEYQVDPDSGIIGCICSLDDDDGFTIQCDICFRWQHCLCMDYSTNDEIPEDEYKCYYCDKEKWGKFDPEACRINTLARLEPESSENNLPDSNKDNKNEEDTENKPADKSSNKRKALNYGKVDDRKKRKTEQPADSGNVSKTDTNGGAPNTAKASKDRRKQLKDDFNNVPTPKADEPPSFIPNKDNELLEDGFTAENYQSTYYKLRSNDYRNHVLQDHFHKLGAQFHNRYKMLSNEEKAQLNIEVMSLKDFKSIPKLYIVLPSYEKHLRENGQSPKPIPKISIQVKAYSDAQKQKFNGISKLGLFIQHSSKVEKFDKNDKSDDNDSKEDFEEVLPKGTPILEYFGVLDSFTEYRDNKTNQYHVWGTTKPKVLKSGLSLLDDHNKTKTLDVVLDSRFVGNETRFIRKACPNATNCEIKKFYIPDTNSFKFLVVTSKDITLTKGSADEELRLPWEWDEIHPIRKMYGNEEEGIEGLKFDQLSEKERSLLVSTVDNILYFTECGCSTASNTPLYLPNCAVFKVRKAITYLLRSTRKISGLTNVNLYKPREELILPKEPKTYISWEERLYERDKFIQTKLFLPTRNETTNADNKNKDDKFKDVDVSFKLPLRQRILNKQLASKSASPVKQENEGNQNNEIEPSEFIPITKELQNKIKTSVEGEVKVKPEIERSLSKVDLTIASDDTTKLDEIKKVLKIDIKETKPEESKVHEENVVSGTKDSDYFTHPKSIGEIAKTPSTDDANVLEARDEVPEPVAKDPTPEPKPVVKKKLSFADYKKKMK